MRSFDPMMRALLSLALFTCGCASGLRVTPIQTAYRRPSNVAVFFSVDRSNGEPVPGLAATDFQIYEDGSMVSVHESLQTIVNPEQAAEHFTLLLVDMSGSVTQSDEVPLIIQAATEFAQTVERHQRVGIYAFDGEREIHPIVAFTESRGSAAAGATRLGTFQPRDPSTNLNGAIMQGIQTLDEAMSHSSVPLRFGTLVVFTDGTDRAARVSQDDMLEAVADTPYDVFVIGVGNEIDESVLRHVGRNGYARAQDVGAIQSAFQQIGQRIVGITQRYYLLSYCSPARAQHHRVTIRAVTPNDHASGEASYDFDATGFGPDCDPNVPPPFDTTGRARPHQAPTATASGAAPH